MAGAIGPTPGWRALPSDLAGPSKNHDAPVAAAGSETAWLQPIPDVTLSFQQTEASVIHAVVSTLGVRGMKLLC